MLRATYCDLKILKRERGILRPENFGGCFDEFVSRNTTLLGLVFLLSWKASWKRNSFLWDLLGHKWAYNYMHLTMRTKRTADLFIRSRIPNFLISDSLLKSLHVNRPSN